MKNYHWLSDRALIDLLDMIQKNSLHNPLLCLHKSLTNDEFISMICCIYHKGNCYECLRHYLQEEHGKMRYITGLKSINDISTLLKYLYLSEDHKVTITNTIGITLDIKMNSNFTFTSTFVNGICPGKSQNCTSEITIDYLRDLVEYLKEQKPIEFTDVFKNRWDEIVKVTESNLGLNYLNQRRMNNED